MALLRIERPLFVSALFRVDPSVDSKEIGNLRGWTHREQVISPSSQVRLTHLEAYTQRT